MKEAVMNPDGSVVRAGGAVELADAGEFLGSRFGGSVTDVAESGRGAWSRAFSFRVDARELVIRFGQHRVDYEIDQRAMGYASPDLPVPAVIEIGSALGGAYAISERRHGRFLESLDAESWHRLLPSLWRALDAMRAQPEQWPEWLLEQPQLADGPGGRWGAQLLAALEDRPDERVSGWQATLAGFPDLNQLFADARGRFIELLASCPTSGHLIHSDLLNRNVLVAEDARHLTAVFDWSCQRRGDFLYDIAWLTFWAPWHPGLAAVDIRAGALQHYKALTVPVHGFDERLSCYELHIGLEHLAYNAFIHDSAELHAVGQRLRKLLDSL
jgi:aminoglycoside phosphotransferase (APT) family kinase protein